MDTQSNTVEELGAKLLPQHKLFADNYLQDQSGRRAYLETYPKCKSPAAADSNAYKLLKRPDVKAYLQLRFAEKAAEFDINTDRILKEESCLAYSDLRKTFSEGVLISPDNLPEEIARAVAGFEMIERSIYSKEGDILETITTFKYRFWDKGRALQRLESYLGMDRSGDGSVERSLEQLGDRLEAAIKRMGGRSFDVINGSGKDRQGKAA